MLRQTVTNQLPDLYFSGFHLPTELVRRAPETAGRSPIWAACSMPNLQSGATANYSEKIVDLGRVNGKLYGMPVNASTPLMYFNEELVKKAGGDPAKMPDTWEEVIALAAKIRAGGSVSGRRIQRPRLAG